MNICIIGIGNMGRAIAKALAKKHRVYVNDKNPGKAKMVGTIFDGSLQHLSRADYVIIAVKPQDIIGLSRQLKINQQTILISIAAGVKIAKIQKLFNLKKIIRMMPNLGVTVGHGLAAWKSKNLSAKDKIAAKKLLDQICENFEVGKESALDAVTAISGSGLAYFFYFAQGLERAARGLGFSKALARQLVEKTFRGAATLQANANYQELMDRVASKKGTTERALRVFKQKKLHQMILQAVKAAQSRAKEISNE